MKILSSIQQKNYYFSGFIALALLFFFAHRLFVKTPGRIEQIASRCVYPFMLAQNYVLKPIKLIMSRNQEVVDLQIQIKILKQENEELNNRLTQLEALKIFAQKTTHMKTFEKRYETDNIHLCQIIMRRFTGVEQIFFVDGGSTHGVVQDMAAVYKNMIVGKVVQVYPYYSKVASIADKRCKVAAYCSRTQTEGIFQGANILTTMDLNHVDHLKKLRKNESIISSGQGTVFPRGFLLGTLESFIPNGVHYQVKVKPAVNLEELEYCYLIQKGKEKA